MTLKILMQQLLTFPLKSKQLQSAVAEVSETEEQAITGRNLSTQYDLKSYTGLLWNSDSNNLIGIVRTTFTF